jgi:hypothetical protein
MLHWTRCGRFLDERDFKENFEDVIKVTHWGKGQRGNGRLCFGTGSGSSMPCALTEIKRPEAVPCTALAAPGAAHAPN